MQATVNAPPAPTLSITTAFGTAGLSSSGSTPSTSSTLSNLSFPVVTESSSAQTVKASDWVALQATVSNSTSSTTWSVYGSATALSSSDGSTPASDISAPAYNGSVWAEPTGGYADYLHSRNAPSATPLGSSTAALYSGLSPGAQPFLAFRPTVVIPAHTAPGTYTGTIDLAAGVN